MPLVDLVSLTVSFFVAIAIATTGAGKSWCQHDQNLCAQEDATNKTTTTAAP